MNADREAVLSMLESMYLTRKFEETAIRLFAEGHIHGTTHLYIGEEAVASGVCEE